MLANRVGRVAPSRGAATRRLGDSATRRIGQPCRSPARKPIRNPLPYPGRRAPLSGHAARDRTNPGPHPFEEPPLLPRLPGLLARARARRRARHHHSRRPDRPPGRRALRPAASFTRRHLLEARRGTIRPGPGGWAKTLGQPDLRHDAGIFLRRRAWSAASPYSRPGERPAFAGHGRWLTPSQAAA